MTKELLQYYTDSIWTKIKALFATKEEAVNGILVKGNRTLVETVNANTTIALPSLDTFGELYVEMHHVDGTIVHQVNINKDALLFESTNTEYREILLDGIHDAQTYVTYDIANNTIIPTYCEGVEIDETSTDVTTSVYIVSGDEMSATNLTASNITYNDGTVADALDDIVENGVKNGTELTDILPSGQTTITFTSEEITNDSKLNAVYTSIFDVQLESASFGDGTLTLVFPAQEEDMEVVALINATSTGDDIIAREVMDELNTHIGDTDNPHGVTAEQISVDNSVSGLSAENVQGALDEVVDTIGYTKSYNLLPCNKITGTWNGMTYTPNLNADDLLLYYSLSGTRDAETYYDIYNGALPKGLEVGKTYKVNTNTTEARFYMYIYQVVDGVGETVVNTSNDGEDALWTIKPNTTQVIVRISVVATAGTFTDVRFYPMIRPAEIEDSSYVPYIPDVDTKIDTLTNVTRIYEALTITSTTDLTENYRFTANRNCIVSLSASAHHSNAVPKQVVIQQYSYEDGNSAAGITSASPAPYVITTSSSTFLRRGESLKVKTSYFEAGKTNALKVSGYVQYLE